ncbi:MAG TPA: hypothetical protein DGO89_15730 [Microcoleaceae bacterium UBA9251]|nr:hypothetical protein [Microcoleaceae cyanobacterium UBA9251]
MVWSRGLFPKIWVLIRIFVILGINMSGNTDILDFWGAVLKQMSRFGDILATVGDSPRDSWVSRAF